MSLGLSIAVNIQPGKQIELWVVVHFANASKGTSNPRTHSLFRTSKVAGYFVILLQYIEGGIGCSLYPTFRDVMLGGFGLGCRRRLSSHLVASSAKRDSSTSIGDARCAALMLNRALRNQS